MRSNGHKKWLTNKQFLTFKRYFHLNLAYKGYSYNNKTCFHTLIL